MMGKYKIGKKIFFFAFFVLISIGIFYSEISYKLYDKVVLCEFYISSRKAGKMWGHIKFDAEKFRTSNKTRNAMMSDLIDHKLLIGLPYRNIKGLLGESDGMYYNSDDILTYRVHAEFDSSHNLKQNYDLILIPSNSDKENIVKDVLLWRSYPRNNLCLIDLVNKIRN